MPYTNFAQLNEAMIKHFQNKRYPEALKLILEEGGHFPDDRMDVDYWKMVSAARIDDRQTVYAVARALLADGLWFGEFLLRQSPSFASLQGDPEFEHIVAESQAAQIRDMPSEPVVITKFPSQQPETSPLLVALHGNQSSAEKTLPFWAAAVSEGWNVAIPQSNQALQKGALGWDGSEASFTYVRERFDAFDFAFDPKRVVIAGHSMGGLVAIRMALEGMLPVCGFIVIGPAVPYLDEEESLPGILALARARSVRACFIVGEKDDDIFIPKVIELGEKISAAGIVCQVEMVPNATHDHSPAYDGALVRGLKFLMNGKQ